VGQRRLGKEPERQRGSRKEQQIVGSARYRPESDPSVGIEVTIARVGARGDGIFDPGGAGKAGDRVFVPLTVPGDRVRVRLGPVQAEGRRGQVLAWLARGPDAVEPACHHFGRCGGCTLQHFGDPGYGAWKAEQVAAALERAGFAPDRPVPLVRTAPGGRRRATFSVQRRGGAVLVGFKERLSHRLVDLEQCPVLAPELIALVPVLRRGLAPVLAEGGIAEVAVTRVESGLDLVLVGPDRLGLSARQALAELASAADLSRLSWQPRSGQPPEPVAARRPALVRFGGYPVLVPPGAFLQASAEGEAALTAAVLTGVGAGAMAVADLFAGCGTFSLPLAGVTGRRVLGVDGNGAALAALADHWTPGPGPGADVAAGTDRLRGRGVRSAPGRGSGAGRGAGRLKRAGGGGGFVQPRDLRPRCPSFAGGRLSAHHGFGGGPVPVVGSHRAGCGV